VLKSIDVLIGLAVVLLALSMAVTVLTQSITTLVNSRGRHLRRGLTDLLEQLDPTLTPALSKAIATRLLTHPLVSGSNTPIASRAASPGLWSRLTAAIRRAVGGPRLGNVIHRGEFTKLLLEMAGDDGLRTADAKTADALRTALGNNGIAHPDAVLKSIRAAALRLERSNPELAHVARQNLAILQEAESDLVAKIHNWFDQSMDRTSQRFTASTRAITFAAAVVVAFGLQVDTLSLVNRLAADDALRQAFVDRAIAAERSGTTGSDAAASEAAAGAPGEAAGDARLAQEYRAFLAENGVIIRPSAFTVAGIRDNLLGLGVTALLLSLGAPFWYGALRNLLQLRSVIAARDDAERTARQTTNPPGSGGPGPPPPSTGERGDLLAMG
jgi:hypothetical protein